MSAIRHSQTKQELSFGCHCVRYPKQNFQIVKYIFYIFPFCFSVSIFSFILFILLPFLFSSVLFISFLSVTRPSLCLPLLHHFHTNSLHSFLSLSPSLLRSSCRLYFLFYFFSRLKSIKSVM